MKPENLRLQDCKTPNILQSHQELAEVGLVGLTFNPPPLSGTWVYFVGCAGFVKIGVTCDLIGRLSTLRTSNPHPVGLLGLVEGTASDEADLHGLFKEKRVRGEWFLLTEDDILGVMLACDYSALSESLRGARVFHVKPKQDAVERRDAMVEDLRRQEA